jgi:uncharacterized OB-fold protein
VSSSGEEFDPAGDQVLLSSLGAPWREALRSGTLLVQRCIRCSAARWYPRAGCSACGSSEAEDIAASGDGTIVSITTVATNAAPEFSGQTPYVLAMIRLDEGASMIARLSDGGPAPTIGDEVTADWHAPLRHGLTFKLRSPRSDHA